MKIKNLKKAIKESEGHKPVSAMPTEELKQIMRDEKDKTSAKYMAAKHEILHRKVNAKESLGEKKNKNSAKEQAVALAKLKHCKIISEKVHAAIGGIIEHMETANLNNADVDSLYHALEDVKDVIVSFVEKKTNG